MKISQLFNKSSLFVRVQARSRFIAAIIFLGIMMFFGVFALAEHYNFDMGILLGQCGFKQRYNLPCPTCGMTTAVLAFSSGRILQAFYIQPAAGLICVIMVIAAVLEFIAAVFGVYFRIESDFLRTLKAKYIVLSLVIIILAGWTVTMARVLAGN
jgi:hypothetical protein